MQDQTNDLQAAAQEGEQARTAFAQKYGGMSEQPVAQQQQQPPPQTTPQEQPEGDPELMQLAKEGAEHRASFAQRYGAQNVTDVHDDSDKQSMMGSLLLGGHMGMMELTARLTQLGIKPAEIAGYMPKGTGKEFIRQFNEKYLKDPQFLASLRQHPVATRIGEFAEPLIPQMALPFGAAGKIAGKAAEAVPAVARFAPAAARAAQGYLTGALQYAKTPKEAEQQKVIGAVTAMLVPPGVRRAAGALGAGVKAITPKLAEAAERAGVKLSPFPMVEKVLARIPGAGVKKVIAERGELAAKRGQQIANDIIKEAGGEPVVTDVGEEKGYAKHFTGELLKHYSAVKAAVGSMKRGLMKQSDKFTERTGGAVNPLEMKIAASNELANQQALSPEFQNKSLIEDLTKHQNANPMTYRAADALRKQLDDKINTFGTKATGVQKNLRRMYISMRSGLANDIKGFAKQVSPEFEKKHFKADELYASKVAPFDRSPYSKLITGDMNSGQFISKFLKPAREVAGEEAPEDITKLLSLMPKGGARAQKAMRAAIMSRALETADLPGGGINGKKFADNALKLSKQAGGIFSKTQKDTLKGYQILTHHLEKYQPKVTDISKIQGTSIPRNILHMGGLGLAFWHPYITGAIYASGLGMSKLFTTKVGQSLLSGVAKMGAKAGDAKLNPLVSKGLKLILTRAGSQIGGG